VVGLRTIAVLTKEYKISLQKLCRVAEELVRRGYERDGQLALVPVIDVINDVEARVQDLKMRDDEQLGHVERNRFVVHNSR